MPEAVPADERAQRFEAERPDADLHVADRVVANDGFLQWSGLEERGQTRGRFARRDEDSGRFGVRDLEVVVAVEVVVRQVVAFEDVAVQIADEMLVDRDPREPVPTRDVADDMLP